MLMRLSRGDEKKYRFEVREVVIKGSDEQRIRRSQCEGHLQIDTAWRCERCFQSYWHLNSGKVRVLSSGMRVGSCLVGSVLMLDGSGLYPYRETLFVRYWKVKALSPGVNGWTSLIEISYECFGKDEAWNNIKECLNSVDPITILQKNPINNVFPLMLAATDCDSSHFGRDFSPKEGCSNGSEWSTRSECRYE